MANPAKKNEAENPGVGIQIPEGYKDQNKDALIWDGTGAIHFIPRMCNLVDSELNENRPSCLVLGDLVDARQMQDRDDKTVRAEPGTLVGVWVSGGSKKLINLCGSKVFVYQDGTMEMGGGKNPMKVIRLMAPDGVKNELVPLEGDFRKKSRNVETPWTRKPGDRRIEKDDDGDDAIPF